MQYTVKELRARKKWTQAETAVKLGVSRQTYNAWENGMDNLTVTKIKALADLFGVEFSEIFLG